MTNANTLAQHSLLENQTASDSFHVAVRTPNTPY
jgi:hypothetical protein